MTIDKKFLSKRSWRSGNNGRIAHIGNRGTATESGAGTTYTTNSPNQYSSLVVPVFDASGNQTLVRSPTGTWSTFYYNVEDRPVAWANFATNIVVEMIYLKKRDERSRKKS